MRKTTLLLGLLLAGVAATASAADKVTVQLKWLPQAQFAGYYVAQAKGFYKDAGLDVTIKPGGPDISPAQVLAAKGADVTVDWMPSALAAREAGVPMVNIAQIFNRSGMMLTCKKSSGVLTPKDFKGKTLGVWFGGNEYPFLSWMGTLGLKTSGANPDVKVLKQGFNVDPLLQNQAACISTMIYNEYWQVIDAGVKASDLVTFPYEDQGVATLEDGLYARGPDLKDPAYVAKLGKFVKASIQGWEYALKHEDEAVKIVLAADTSGGSTAAVQKRQLENVAKLITNAGTPKMGYLDPAAYQRTVKVLLAGGSDPVIKKDPGPAAWTHAVWDKAMGK
ncbi:MAG: ABC transporter substrate-binding protein [Burkholderiales bacterium]|nr:ABC transporter substrate-binding protein [Burkholderiales bacterium]